MVCSGYCGCCKGTVPPSQGQTRSGQTALAFVSILANAETAVGNWLLYVSYVTLRLSHVKFNGKGYG